MTTRHSPFKDRLKFRKRIVLFIATGDTCRSPMAAGFFKKLLDEAEVQGRFDIRSAGVSTAPGLLASPEAMQIMEAEHVDLSRHRSTKLTEELIRRADLILAMTPYHRQDAIRLSRDAKDKTYLLKEFSGSDLKNVQIQDPMGFTLEVFKKSFKEIRAACVKLVKHEYFVGKENAEAAKKKPAAKKTAKKKTAKKSTAKKSTTKKSAAKKASTGKSTAKKSAAKKSAAKKSTAKKAATQKATPRKTASKSTAKKSASAKKSTGKSTTKKKA